MLHSIFTFPRLQRKGSRVLLVEHVTTQRSALFGQTEIPNCSCRVRVRRVLDPLPFEGIPLNKHAIVQPPVLTTEQSNLQRIELRIRGLALNSPQSPEVARMEAARKDVMSRMSKEDLAVYDRITNSAKSKEQLQAEAEAERLAMDANKDKPPI